MFCSQATCISLPIEPEREREHNERIRRKGAACQCRTTTLSPVFFHVQKMSNACPTIVLILSNLCPCPSFVQVLSYKSYYCPGKIQFLSKRPHSDPNNVLTMSNLLACTYQKVAGQSLDKYQNNLFSHSPPGYPADGQKLDKFWTSVVVQT